MSVCHVISNSNSSVSYYPLSSASDTELTRTFSFYKKNREMIKTNDDKWWYHSRQQQRPSLLLSVLYQLLGDIWDIARQDLFFLETIQSTYWIITINNDNTIPYKGQWRGDLDLSFIWNYKYIKLSCRANLSLLNLAV